MAYGEAYLDEFGDSSDRSGAQQPIWLSTMARQEDIRGLPAELPPLSCIPLTLHSGNVRHSGG